MKILLFRNCQLKICLSFRQYLRTQKIKWVITHSHTCTTNGKRKKGRKWFLLLNTSRSETELSNPDNWILAIRGCTLPPLPEGAPHHTGTPGTEPKDRVKYNCNLHLSLSRLFFLPQKVSLHTRTQIYMLHFGNQALCLWGKWEDLKKCFKMA